MQLITKEESKKSYNSKVAAINEWQNGVVDELKSLIQNLSINNDAIDVAFQRLQMVTDVLRTKCYLNQCLTDNLQNDVFRPSDIKRFIN